MNAYKEILEMAKEFEKKADETLAKYPGYPKVKEFLEGKTQKADVRAMIMDSKAFFSGKNNPAELIKTALDSADTGLTLATGTAKELLNKQEKKLSDQLEKKNAIIENRSAARIYKVEKDDTILNGRLMSNDGKKPIAGAKVLIRIKGDGTSKPALAQAVTDMNGEYSIPLNKNKLKSAGENISVNFETRKGVKLANSKNIAINSVRGKAKTIDGKISADKVESAEGLIADTETNKHHAYLEMAELKKSEAQMTHFQYKTETTKNELKEKISKLRNLFEAK